MPIAHWFSTFFHAVIHFETQFNLTNPSKNFHSGICNAVVFAQQKIAMTDVEQRLVH